MMREISVGMISLGCAKNQVDSELMLGKLCEAGFQLTQDESRADVIIVNTCSFIESAREEAIQTILEAAQYKKPENGRCRALIVTGCLSQRYPQEIRESLPEVDAILDVNSYAEIAAVAERCLMPDAALPVCISSEDDGISYLNGSRILTTPAGSAYLKIAEGCDNRCAYCAIPLIRGRFRSRPIEDLLKEARNLVREGVRELNIIAQDTSRYGTDLYGKPSLDRLIAGLEEIQELRWIRILYLYPDEITENLLEAMKNSTKLVPYVDLPLQHISESVLKRMNRRGTPEEIRSSIRKMQRILPECVLRTSFIVGFPGETEKDFQELCDFVTEFAFDRVGVFCYSPEEGTTAAEMPDQIPEEVKEARRAKLMELAAGISFRKNKEREGKVVPVLTESVSEDGIFYVGRSYAEAPDVDGKVYFTSEESLNPGDFADVRIVIGEEYDVTGVRVMPV